MNIFSILSIIATLCAIFDITVNLLIICKRKMIFNCNIYIAQYLMAIIVLISIAKNILSKGIATIIFISLTSIFILILYIFRQKGLSFYRIFGLKCKMHDKLQKKLTYFCQSNKLDRTRIYLYGGDAKTACNTLTFRHVKNSIENKVILYVNKFLKKYSSPNLFYHISAILLDIAVIYIIFYIF